jgi:hypothetical protein
MDARIFLIQRIMLCNKKKLKVLPYSFCVDLICHSCIQSIANVVPFVEVILFLFVRE